MLKKYLRFLQGKEPDPPKDCRIKVKDQGKVKARIKKAEEMLEKFSVRVQLKEDNKSVALNTSKINYMDPRITVAWCKNNEVPIEKIFPKALRSKFIWAMYSEPSWEF